MRFEKWLLSELDRLIVILNGGKGSGNFGHAGRPGKVGGSQPQKRKEKKRRYDMNLDELEKDIVSLDYEYSGIYAQDGERIFHKSGNKNSVMYTRSEIDRMFGKILTHNHPGGWAFSQEDLDFQEQARLFEIRAVTDTYTYSIKNEDWANPENVFRNNFRQAIISVSQRETKYTGRDFNHEVLKEYAKTAGLKYERIKHA